MDRQDLRDKFKAEIALHKKLEKETKEAWQNAIKTIDKMSCENCCQKLPISNYAFCEACNSIICNHKNNSYSEPCYVTNRGSKICARCLSKLLVSK